MAAFSSAAAQLTAEGTITDVAAALAVMAALFETDDVWKTQIVLLPNGLFQGVAINAVI